MNFRRYFNKVKKITGLSAIQYYLTRKHLHLKSDKHSVAESRERLEKLSENPKSSCITQNNLQPEYDLQIIVPVYNVENYIEDCMNSILKPAKNTFGYTFLVTVVEDGSTDKTAEKLKKYSNNEHVSIIYQQNKGHSGARNTSIKNIIGKYLFFVDSDDIVLMDNVFEMLDFCVKNDADIVQGEYYRLSREGKKKHSFHKKNAFTGFVWGKIYKSELFGNLCFSEKYWFEDGIVAQILKYKAKKILYFYKNVYAYRINEKGITFVAKKQNKCIDTFWIMEQLYYDRLKTGLRVNQDYYEYILRNILLSYRRTSLMEESVKKDVFLLMSNFLNENFNGFYTKAGKMKGLENALRNADYGYYEAFCESK